MSFHGRGVLDCIATSGAAVLSILRDFGSNQVLPGNGAHKYSASTYKIPTGIIRRREALVRISAAQRSAARLAMIVLNMSFPPIELTV
jgi:hypothetical protein